MIGGRRGNRRLYVEWIEGYRGDRGLLTKHRAIERKVCRRVTEGRRGDRWLVRKHNAIDRFDGRREKRGL
jgi:hypothetical protein